MSAAWAINSIGIYVNQYSAPKQQFVANNVPLGATVPERQWSGAITQHRITGFCHAASRDSIKALSGASSYPFTGPGGISVTLSIDSVVDNKLRDGILDGVVGAIWLLNITATSV